MRCNERNNYLSWKWQRSRPSAPNCRSRTWRGAYCPSTWYPAAACTRSRRQWGASLARGRRAPRRNRRRSCRGSRSRRIGTWGRPGNPGAPIAARRTPCSTGTPRGSWATPGGRHRRVLRRPRRRPRSWRWSHRGHSGARTWRRWRACDCPRRPPGRGSCRCRRSVLRELRHVYEL